MEADNRRALVRSTYTLPTVPASTAKNKTKYAKLNWNGRVQNGNVWEQLASHKGMLVRQQLPPVSKAKLQYYLLSFTAVRLLQVLFDSTVYTSTGYYSSRGYSSTGACQDQTTRLSYSALVISFWVLRLVSHCHSCGNQPTVGGKKDRAPVSSAER